MEIVGAWMCFGGNWVLSPCSMEPKHYFGTILKVTTFFHLNILRLQNTKTPHISFPKIIGLGHFLEFLGSPEKNHLLQMLLITLYNIQCIWCRLRNDLVCTVTEIIRYYSVSEVEVDLGIYHGISIQAVATVAVY